MQKLFSKFSHAVAETCGRPITFAFAVLLVVIWAATGPVFNYSDNWQLIINTGSGLITFLMVFVLQNSQNRDGVALQTKLDELILTSKARNKFIGIEKLDATELQGLSDQLLKYNETVTEVVEEDLREAKEEERAAGGASTPMDTP